MMEFNLSIINATNIKMSNMREEILGHLSILLDLTPVRIQTEDSRTLKVEEILDLRKHTWKIHMIKADHRPLLEAQSSHSKREAKKVQTLKILEDSPNLNKKEVEEWSLWLITQF